MTGAIVITTTAGTRADAEQIAAKLVGEQLAACVQVSGPIESTFPWEGKQQTSTEWLVTIKTLATKFTAVERAILEVHPYELPEIIAVPIVAAHEGYLEWLTQSLESDA
jgi:periplasmic divalent cation tolerance protein